MKDFKEKLPDFKEITAIAGKFYKDVKTSVCEIINDYKKKHTEEKVSKGDVHKESAIKSTEQITKQKKK